MLTSSPKVVVEVTLSSEIVQCSYAALGGKFTSAEVLASPGGSEPTKKEKKMTGHIRT